MIANNEFQHGNVFMALNDLPGNDRCPDASLV